MQFAIVCLLVVGVAVTASAEAQFGFGHPEPNYFRAGIPQASFDDHNVAISSNARSFFTVTLTFSTATSTSVTTSVTTCTTSTSSLPACTPSARRRRGVLLGSKKQGRGLFYNENDEEQEEGSIFLPSPPTPVEPVAEVVREERQTAPIPFVVQPGFSAPGAGNARFLFAFSTSTTTVTSTSVFTTSLTAICASTTGYQLCGSSGK